MENQNYANDDMRYIELLKKESSLYVINVYKEENRCGLAEAKDYIDNLRARLAEDEAVCELQQCSSVGAEVDCTDDGCQPAYANDRNENPVNDDRKYIELLKSQDSVIYVIKVYYEDKKCGLAEAKNYVDNLLKRSDVREEIRKARAERPEKEQHKGGCLSSIAVLLIILSVAVCFL